MTTPDLDERIAPGCHLVQLYGRADDPLVANIVHFVHGGLQRGEGVIAIWRPSHADALRSALSERGIDVTAALASGQLTIADPNNVLSRIMIGGHPDADRFEAVVMQTLRDLRQRFPIGLRACGEAVGLLWQTGQYPAAIRLEQLWHRAFKQGDFALFCAYPVDIFGHQFTTGVVDALLSSHTHLLSTGNAARLEASLARAAQEVLGIDAFANVAADVSERPCEIPRAESVILQLRQREKKADEIIARAATYYDAGGISEAAS